MKKNFLFVIVLGLLFTKSKAQLVSPDVATHFSPGVVARVYEVSSKISLSASKQLAVAKQFKYEDSLLADMIVKGEAPSDIIKSKRNMQTAFQQILTTKENNDYYTQKLNDEAKKEGQLMGMLVQRKYNCDNVLQDILADLYYQRKLNVDKAFYLPFADSSLLDNRLIAVIVKYDSLIAKYIKPAEGTDYINNKIALLDSIKALTQQQKNDLKKNFLSLCYKRDKSYADNFNDAMHQVIPDTLYYAEIYRDEIGRVAASNYSMAITTLVSKNKSTKDGMHFLEPIVLEKEKKLATINYAYPYFSKSKESMIQSTTRYYDSLIGIALMQDGSVQDGSKFSLAVKNRQKLGLNQTQVDTMLAKVILLVQLKSDYAAKNPDQKFNVKVYECEQLPNILTAEQYNELLVINNRDKALKWAKGDWAELQKRQLTEGLDSAKTVHQIYSYDLNRLIINERYENDKAQLTTALQSLATTQPGALRKLKAAQKNSSVANDTAKGNLQW